MCYHGDRMCYHGDGMWYRIVPSKHQKLRVGGYTEKVLECFNYPRARAHPGCKVNCQGVPHRRFVLRQGQPDSGESCIVLQS